MPKRTPVQGRGRRRTPTWVKIAIGVTAAFLLVVVVMMVAGGGQHGAGRHTGGDTSGVQQDAGEHTPPAGFGGHTPPEGAHP